MSDQLIPASIADARFRALDQLAANRFAALPLTRVLVYVIDSVEPSALPALAWQFGSLGEAWRLASDEGARRALIKRVLVRRRHKGTDFAVWDALDAAGILNRVVPTEQEPIFHDGVWSYNGAARHAQPAAYVFRVVVVGEPSPSQLTAIQKTVTEWKRLSVRFEVFWVSAEEHLDTPGEYHATAA